MAYLTLITGLMLPWIAGAAWMGAVEARFGAGGPGARARNWGHGFFIGYAALGFVLLTQSALTGGVSWGAPMLVLAALAALGGWLCLRANSVDSPAGGPSVPIGEKRRQSSSAVLTPVPSAVGRLLLALFLAWAALHLLLALLDEFTIPVYPWDAWLLWLYRAKAWFFSGNIFELISAADWLRSTDPGAYTVDAVGYPLLPSIFPLWAALSYGAWSETLVALPTFLCGVALGLALFGQSRRAGSGPLIAMTVVYLLYATPLVGTHLSLAGYADLWMAGFAGLGFLALLQGRIEGARYPVLLGLVLVALGMMVKNEGVVWFVAWLVLWFMLSVRWWISLAMAALLAVLTGAALHFGVDPVHLPFGQTFSIVGDRVDLPFIAAFKLEAYSPWRIYSHGLFAMDTWNLLWTMLAVTAVFALARIRQSASRVVLVFFLVFCATQVFIFGFTQHGQFGESYTASNRLLMHFLPALLYSMAVILASVLQRAFGAMPTVPRWRRFTPPVLAAIIALGGVYVVVAGGVSDTNEDVEAMVFAPAAFTPIVGEWNVEDNRLSLMALTDGFGAASVQGTRIDAGTHYLLHFEVTGELRRPVLFWRTRDNPQEVVQLDLWDNQSDYIDLRGREGWSGEVTELGILYRAMGDEQITVSGVSLGPETVATRLSGLIDGWFQPEPWTQRSVNFRTGGAAVQAVFLPTLLSGWFVLTVLIGAVLLRKDRGALVRIAALVLLLGWLLLDLRWTSGRLAQADDRVAALSSTMQEKLDAAEDGELAAFARRMREEYFDNAPGRILILNDGTMPDYYEFKLKYHLLPLASGQGRGRLRRAAPQHIDYILVMSTRADGREMQRLRSGNEDSWDALRMPMQLRERYGLADAGEFGFLFMRRADSEE